MSYKIFQIDDKSSVEHLTMNSDDFFFSSKNNFKSYNTKYKDTSFYKMISKTIVLKSGGFNIKNSDGADDVKFKLHRNSETEHLFKFISNAWDKFMETKEGKILSKSKKIAYKPITTNNYEETIENCNIDENAKKQRLEELLSKYGHLNNVDVLKFKIPIDQKTGNAKIKIKTCKQCYELCVLNSKNEVVTTVNYDYKPSDEEINKVKGNNQYKMRTNAKYDILKDECEINPKDLYKYLTTGYKFVIEFIIKPYSSSTMYGMQLVASAIYIKELPSNNNNNNCINYEDGDLRDMIISDEKENNLKETLNNTYYEDKKEENENDDDEIEINV